MARSGAPMPSLSDWATVCTDSELRGFLSSSSPWDPSPHYLEWECGREAGEGKTRAKNSIWIIICLPFRQRLTAGALVCDRLDMCAFNKPGRVAYAHQHAPGWNYKTEQSALCVKDRSAALYFKQLYFSAVCFAPYKVTAHPRHPLCSVVAHMYITLIIHTCAAETGLWVPARAHWFTKQSNHDLLCLYF